MSAPAAPITIMHLSDPHFGTEIAEVVHALKQLSHALQPQLLILSGDITQRARARQFRAARQFVDQLGIAQRLVIAGNHDIPLFNLWARAFNPYGGWQREFGPELEPILDTERLLVIGVRSTRRWRHKNGEVSAAQRERVVQRLRQARPDQLKLVVTHQPLDVVTDSDQENLIRGSARTRAAWLAAGADLLLAGHIHLPHLRALQPLHPGAQNLPMAVQAGTALSHRLRGRAPNSVNVIRLFAPDEPGEHAAHVRGVVWRYDYQAEQRCFGKQAELGFFR